MWPLLIITLSFSSFKRMSLKAAMGAIAVCMAISGKAQSPYKVELGLTGAVAGKFSILDWPGERYVPPGALRLAASLYMEDRDPESLSFLCKLGIVYDNDGYLVNNDFNLKVRTTQFNLMVNPEILFPLADSRFKIGTGIGFERLIFKTLWINGISSTAIDSAYYYGNMDQKQRNIVPFINVDFWFVFSPNVWLTLGLQQPLLKSYYSGQDIMIGNVDFKLQHQPTYVNAAIFYKFH